MRSLTIKSPPEALVLLLLACVLGPARALAQDPAAGNLNSISSVNVRGGTVEIVGTKKPNFTTFTLTDPPRLVIDISEAVFSGVKEDITVGNGTITAIRTASYGSDESAIARVLIGYEREVETDIQARGNSLVVNVAGGAGVAAAPTGTAPAAADSPSVAPAARPTDEEQTGAAAQAAQEEQKRQAGATAQAAQAAQDERKQQELAAAQAAEQEQADAEARRQAQARAETERKEQEASARAATQQAEQQRLQQERAAEKKQQQDEARAAAEARRDSEAQAAEAKKRQAAQERAEAQAAAEARRQEQARQPRVAQAEAPRREPAREGGSSAVSSRRKTMMLVGFKQERGASRVFVRTNEPVRYSVTPGDKLLVLELENTLVSEENNTRALDTSFFDTAVASVDANPGPSRTVRVAIRLKQQVPYETRQEGNELSIEFQRPARR
jgi:colicin import membrane protein